MKLKICGMREPDNIKRVAEMKPDYIGFIFYSGSPRCVPIDFEVPGIPSIRRVGVFVDETIEKIIRTANAHSLDLVQLHGNESIEVCEEIKNKGIKVIKSFSVSDQFNFTTVASYKKVVDFFLFDSKGKYPGGNARSFNWDHLNRYDQEVPFFLSGGISLENIDNISLLQKMNLHAIDVNSGVEDSPGLKSIELVHELQVKLTSLK